MQTLLHFLTDLAQNPARQAAYTHDPLATIEAAELPASIYDDLQDNNLSVEALTDVAGICAAGDPGDDPLPDPDPIPDPGDDDDDGGNGGDDGDNGGDDGDDGGDDDGNEWE